MGQIYGIIQKDLDKIVYVGQTKNNYLKRWSGHKQQSKDLSRKYAFCNALRKYGVDSFYPVLLEECSDEDLNAREQFWIQTLNTKIDKEGYNLTDGGDTPSNTTCIPVFQYTIDGKYVKDYPSMQEASKEFSSNSSTIQRAAHGLIPTAHGYRWSLEKKDFLTEKCNTKIKPIYQYDTHKNFIAEFASLKEAALALGDINKKANISAVALGKRTTAYGYIWSYKKYS